MRFAVEVEPCAEDRPQWIHILPLGPHVEARDGRKFSVRDAQEVMRATELPMLIDWEHASEHGDTRAAGWVEELRLEPADAGDRAGLWGRAHWTPQGREHVATRHFRFLSPVVLGKRDLHDGALQFAVERLTSVALTNRPALRMHGLQQFREQLSQRLGPIDDTQEQDMNDQTRRAICQAFGLQPDASDEALVSAARPVLEAAQTAQSLKQACDALTSQLNEARADTAKLAEQLAGYRKESFRSEVQSFLAEGSRAGKIPPAARKRWAEFCLQSEQNFATFKETIYPGLATIGTPAPAPTKKAGRSALRAAGHGVDVAALKRLGFTDEQINDSAADVFDPKKRPAAGEPAPEDDDDLDDDDDSADEGEGDEDDNEPAAGATPDQPQAGG